MNSKVLRKNPKEKMELRKKQKLEMASRLKAKLQDSQTAEPQAPDTETNQVEDRSQRKFLQKKLRVSLKKQENQQKQLHQLKKEMAGYRRLAASLKQEKWEMQQEHKRHVSQLEGQLDEQKRLLERERERLADAEKTIEVLEREKRSRKKRGAKQLQLANEAKQLRESNAVMRQRLANYDSIMKQEYGDRKKELENLRKELAKYQKIEESTRTNPMYLMKYMKKHLTSEYIPELLDLLEQFISLQNLRYFYRGRHNVFYLFMRRVSLLNYRSKARKGRYEFKRLDSEERFGYLDKEENRWMFVDLSNGDAPVSYPVAGGGSDLALSVDSPARGVLRDGQITVTECFSFESEALEPRLERLNGAASEPADHKEYHRFGNFKVLVVGSRFMSEYKSRLEKHGLEVEIHNPYEESYQALKGKASWAEVILVCERHVAHGVWDYIEKGQPYVSVLKRDSKDLIATHAFLTLKRCELI